MQFTFLEMKKKIKTHAQNWPNFTVSGVPIHARCVMKLNWFRSPHRVNLSFSIWHFQQQSLFCILSRSEARGAFNKQRWLWHDSSLKCPQSDWNCECECASVCVICQQAKLVIIIVSQRMKLIYVSQISSIYRQIHDDTHQHLRKSNFPSLSLVHTHTHT